MRIRPKYITTLLVAKEPPRQGSPPHRRRWPQRVSAQPAGIATAWMDGHGGWGGGGHGGWGGGGHGWGGGDRGGWGGDHRGWGGDRGWGGWQWWPPRW